MNFLTFKDFYINERKLDSILFLLKKNISEDVNAILTYFQDNDVNDMSISDIQEKIGIFQKVRKDYHEEIIKNISNIKIKNEYMVMYENIIESLEQFNEPTSTITENINDLINILNDFYTFIQTNL